MFSSREAGKLRGMATDPKPRRFRFSLRTLFVVVTVVALGSSFLPMVVAKYEEWTNKQAVIKHIRAFDDAYIGPATP